MTGWCCDDCGIESDADEDRSRGSRAGCDRYYHTDSREEDGHRKSCDNRDYDVQSVHSGSRVSWGNHLNKYDLVLTLSEEFEQIEREHDTKW